MDGVTLVCHARDFRTSNATRNSRRGFSPIDRETEREAIASIRTTDASRATPNSKSSIRSAASVRVDTLQISAPNLEWRGEAGSDTLAFTRMGGVESLRKKFWAAVGKLSSGV